MVEGVFPRELPLPRLEGSLLWFVGGEHLLVDRLIVPPDANKELEAKHLFTRTL